MTRCLTLLAMACLVTASVNARPEEVLLIPDSGPVLGRVLALSTVDGTVINPNFVPGDARLTQPIQIIDSGRRTLLVTDETAKSVYEYSPSGVYLRTVAAALDGAYGICMRDGFAYVTSGFSSNLGGKIYRIGLDGEAPVVFSDWTGLGDPRGIVPYGAGFLVGNSTTDDLEIVSASGAVAPVPFFNSDGLSSLNFPQQIVNVGAGNWMVVGFSAPWGLYFLDADGLNYASYRSPEVFLSPRGACLLDNGEYLYTGGTRIDRFSVKTYLTTNIVNQIGSSFRWVTRYTLPTPCPADLDGNGSVAAADLSMLLSAWGGIGGPADLDGDGSVAASDLAILLSAWGPCAP
jgi:hypothetical protein